MVSDVRSTPPHATVECAFCLTLNRVNLERIRDRPRCRECSRPILLDRPVRVRDESFDKVIAGADVPVVVDFYADWCGPCKVMAPALDDVANEFSGRVVVAKLNTDENQATAGRFGIRGIPTLIVFVRGVEAARQTGAVPKQGIVALINQASAAG